MPFKKGQSGNVKGRPKGEPNKATQAAREAIALFVDNNAHRLQDWLDRIADGQKGDDDNFIVMPDPERAFSLFQSVIEYHVPKLARSEVTGLNGGAIEHKDVTIIDKQIQGY